MRRKGLLCSTPTPTHRPHVECLPENTHFLKVETAQPTCQALLLQLQEDGDPAKLANGAICADSTYVSMQE